MKHPSNAQTTAASCVVNDGALHVGSATGRTRLSTSGLARLLQPEYLVLVHFSATALAGRLDLPHILLDAAILLPAAWGRPGRRLIALFLPVWLTAVIYGDVLPTALQYRGAIHVADLYQAELRWFGVPTGSGRVIPCDIFREHHWPVVDLVCGGVYIGYQLWLILFVVLVYCAQQPKLLVRLLRVYLLVHLLGFAIYVLYPAAPPWYVEKYGLGPADLQAVSNPAGLARFDALVGIPAAATMYGLSSNVFGAMPSLHMSLATLFPLFGRRLGTSWFLAGMTMASLFAFAAVYFQHHYVWDLLVGIGITLIADWTIGWFERRTSQGRDAVAAA